ncbi:MAG: TM1812 family CRISPR-associated protein [Caldivirga sp.]|uniref:TM1812 family CRISPR-associated protein n=1 Tax=Caldivirga sp. TaxID=2080243 RepID=UPI003D0D6C0B
MSSKVVYVATWGNPLGWNWVKYNCGGGDNAVKNGNEEGFSSVVCINGDNVDKYIIYVLDSVITANASSSINNDAVDVLMHLEESGRVHIVKDRKDDRMQIRVEPDSNISNRDEWRNIVRNYITELAGKWGVDSGKLNVIVTPTIGKYNEWNYSGYPDLITMELLDGLWKTIKDSVNENLTIILDTTHGINFMPVITMFIIRLAASLALLKGSSVVTIKEYNAMPLTWDYRKVFSEQVRFVELPEEPANPVVKAYLMGMPIVVYKLCKLHSSNNQCNTNVDMKISHKDKRIEYKSSIGFKKYYECLLEGLICSKATNKLLELMRGDLFNKVNEVSRRLISSELNNMYDNICNSRLSFEKDTLYASIAKHSEEEGKGCGEESDDRFERNAIAHAGLLKNCTVIRKCDNDYCIDVYDIVLKKLGLSFKS